MNPMSSASKEPPKLPAAQLLILSICRFAEPVALTGVYPYLPEMIESFNVPKKEIGYWAGMASAAFSVGQFFFAIPWVRASDKYGRKPIILLAMFCAMASSLFFGFSKTLSWAIAARVCSGVSNGNVGILRTVVAEMVPQKALQPRAFSTLPLVWQIGAILGPILGGSLASPARKYPELFGDSKFLKEFPFALPNLVSSVIFTIGIIAGILFLKESLESKKHRRDYGLVLGRYLTSCCSSARSQLRPTDDFESNPTMRKPNEKTKPATYREVLTRQSTIDLLAYMLLGLHGVAYDQLLPVLMHLSVECCGGRELPLKFTGGFGLESGRIGLIFTGYAVFSMITQFALFPPLTRRFGSLFCYRVVTFVLPLVYIMTPYTVLLSSDTSRQLAVAALLMIKGLANVFAYPCMTILLTNSVRELRLLGVLNGLATAVAAIGRALGPYVGGRAFTWGAHTGYAVAAWWTLAIFGIAGHIVTWWIEEMDGFEAVPQEDPDEEPESILLDTREAPRRSSGDTDDGAVAEGLEESEEDDESEMVEDKPLIHKKSTSWKA